MRACSSQVPRQDRDAGARDAGASAAKQRREDEAEQVPRGSLNIFLEKSKIFLVQSPFEVSLLCLDAFGKTVGSEQEQQQERHSKSKSKSAS